MLARSTRFQEFFHVKTNETNFSLPVVSSRGYYIRKTRRIPGLKFPMLPCLARQRTSRYTCWKRGKKSIERRKTLLSSNRDK